MRREQTQRMVTVRMDAPIHTALGKLRFLKEAPSVNKLAIWAILDYIMRDSNAFDTLMKSYGIDSKDELLSYLSAVYGYSSPEENPNVVFSETFKEEIRNVQSIA
ncbi:MAG: hypothetical protein PHS86_08980 [Syntrophaceae bacterium]|nr:hypothetical protein [Syntrophaceae bacterium]